MDRAKYPSTDPIETLWRLREATHLPHLAVTIVEQAGQIRNAWTPDREVVVSARLRGPAGVIQRVMPLEDVLIESAQGLIVEDLAAPTSDGIFFCAVGAIHLIDCLADGTEVSSLRYGWILDYGGMSQLPLSDAALPRRSDSDRRPSTGRELTRQLTSLPARAPQAGRFEPALRRARDEGILDSLTASAWSVALRDAREWALVDVDPGDTHRVLTASGPPAIQRPGVDLAGRLAGVAHNAVYEEIVGGRRRTTADGADGTSRRVWYTPEPLSPWTSTASGVTRPGSREDLEQVIRERSLKPLSPQEAEVALLAGEGLDDGGIGEQLGLAVGTVKAVKHRIRQKMRPQGL